MRETIAIIAAILAVIGNVPYLRDVLRGTVKPHPYSWMVWSIVSGTVLVGSIVKGAGVGAIPIAVSEMFTFVIFALSIKHGFKGIRKIDKVLLVVALLGFIPWILTKDPTWSVVIAVLIDLIAFVPTIRKTWKYPETEDRLLYGTNGVRHFLTLFALASYNVATTLHSVVMIMASAAMVFIITLKCHKKLVSQSDTKNSPGS